METQEREREIPYDIGILRLTGELHGWMALKGGLH
jgi:hypothetical protein